MSWRAAWLAAACAGLAACASSAASTGTDATSGDATTGDIAHGLPHVHVLDPAAAARGARLLNEDWPGPGTMPAVALRHTYLAWTTDLLEIYSYYSDDAKYWPAFRARYGLLASPTSNNGLPVGFLLAKDGVNASVTCLICHAGDGPDGVVRVGLANNRLDLQGLYDDLEAMPAALDALKQQPLPEPYKSLLASITVPPIPPPKAGMTLRTGAPGATDAMGLGLNFGALALGIDPDAQGLHTRFGFQNPTAWWTVAFKKERYWDGSVPFGGHRTMMATLLGLGLDFGQLVALDASFGDLEQFLLTIAPPAWPFDPPLPAQVDAGRQVFAATCARCHGTYEGPDAQFPDKIVPLADIGTDPVRVANFGAPEAAVANQLIADPTHAMVPSGGYLAQPLVGVWATAPYFHNGAVPDLAGVVNSADRPARWRRVGPGPDGYDVARMGWKVDVVAGPGIRKRRRGQSTRARLSKPASPG